MPSFYFLRLAYLGGMSLRNWNQTTEIQGFEIQNPKSQNTRSLKKFSPIQKPKIE